MSTFLRRYLPGLEQLLRYRREWLCADVQAGVIAGRTAQLIKRMTRAGLPPEHTGILYFPSRQATLAAYRQRYGDAPAEGDAPPRESLAPQ